MFRSDRHQNLHQQLSHNASVAAARAGGEWGQRRDAELAADLVRRVERYLVGYFLTAADTPDGRTKGVPADQVSKGYFGRTRVDAGTRWNIAGTSRLFMSGKDNLWIHSTGRWRYVIWDRHPHQPSMRIAIGRSRHGLYSPLPPDKSEVTYDSIATHLVDGLQLLSATLPDEFKQRYELRPATDAIYLRIEQLIINYMTNNQITPQPQ